MIDNKNIHKALIIFIVFLVLVSFYKIYEWRILSKNFRLMQVQNNKLKKLKESSSPDFCPAKHNKNYFLQLMHNALKENDVQLIEIKQRSNSTYGVISFSLQMQGSYLNIIQTISKILQNEKLVWIEDFNLYRSYVREDSVNRLFSEFIIKTWTKSV